MRDVKLSKILVVDDDADILDLLAYNLEKEGFKVKTLSNSDETIITAKAFNPDLIILDIMMPEVNGMEICNKLRHMKQFQHTYIFFLTAKSGNFQEAALNVGGDDYIEKIIGLRALIYKVKSVLKNRFVIRKSITELQIGSLKLHRWNNSVSYHDHEVRLSKTEFDLLFFFAQNPDKVISLESLIKNIWGSEIFLLDSSVELYIENIKKKIGSNVIQCLANESYRFVIR